MRFLVLLSLLTVTLGTPVSLTREKRMLIGTDAAPNEFPWQVSIQYMGHVCSGVIITPEWVLTAASCVSRLFAPMITIRYGSNTHNRGGSVVKIIKVVVEPSYDQQLSISDIALLQSSQEFPSTLEPALLARRSTDPLLYEGTQLIVSGWGLQWPGNGQLANSLKKSTLNYIPIDVCRRVYKELNITLDNKDQFCAGSLDNGGPSICQGDVGGPLYLPGLNRVYGIAKFTLGCGESPTVFTDVTAHRGWIKAKTGLYRMN